MAAPIGRLGTPMINPARFSRQRHSKCPNIVSWWLVSAVDSKADWGGWNSTVYILQTMFEGHIGGQFYIHRPWYIIVLHFVHEVSDEQDRNIAFKRTATQPAYPWVTLAVYQYWFHGPFIVIFLYFIWYKKYLIFLYIFVRALARLDLFPFFCLHFPYMDSLIVCPNYPRLPLIVPLVKFRSMFCFSLYCYTTSELGNSQ